MEKGNIRSDILTCNQTYKSLPVLLKVSPEGWSETRNSLLTCVLNAISNESTKSVHKAVAIDQLYSLSFLLNCGKITSIQGYVNIKLAKVFCPLAIIVASKYKF